MMARGFKPVGWVAGVAAAALSCYMLSLNVAAERAELKKLEWRIVMAKREIRTLQTELGTRGRLQQLESWNANVLALSAPTSDQFVDNEVTLARFDQREKTFEERAMLRMASVDAEAAVPAPASPIGAPVRLASAPAPAPVLKEAPLVHKASLVIAEPKPLAAAVAKLEAEPKAKEAPAKPLADSKAKLAAAKPAAPAKTKVAEAKAAPAPAKKKPAIDDILVKQISAAAKAEGKGGDAAR